MRDPFGTHPSFGAHNNARLRAFLDSFGFEYEFLSSTDCYKSGRFDATLLTVARALRRRDENHAAVAARGARADLFAVPADLVRSTGIVLQVPILERDAQGRHDHLEDPDTGSASMTPVTGGHCKLQWKPDWAMRWVALGIDYEMAGKDLIDSVKLSGEIARALGAQPPEGFNYELFLDDKGQKISKSKGNGLTIEEWLRYASPESLSLFMYREPKAAKRLYFDVIPRNVDEYQQFLDGYQRQDGKQRLSNPVWHIHSGNPPKPDMPITFQLLLTLVVVVERRECRDAVGLHRPLPAGRHAADASEARRDGRLCDQLLSRFRRADEAVPRADRGRAHRAHRSARRAVATCRRMRRPRRSRTSSTRSAGASRSSTRRRRRKDGRPGVSLDWFNMLYQVLLGQEKGPRFGSFVAVYGVDNAVGMIDGALARSA